MQPDLQDIDLTLIYDSVGPPPGEKLIGSVAHLGVVQPVILAEHTTDDGEIGYQIVDGNRRVAAARAAGLQSIPAMVITDLPPESLAQLTLVTNNYRTANYLTEFWAIKQLERSGFDRRDILAGAGMSSSAAETRELLSTLDRSLFVAFRNGQLPAQLATATARLSRAGQEAVATAFAHNGSITRKDIDRAAERFGWNKPEKDPDLPRDLEAAVIALVELARQHGIARTRLTGAIDYFWKGNPEEE